MGEGDSHAEQTEGARNKTGREAERHRETGENAGTDKE